MKQKRWICLLLAVLLLAGCSRNADKTEAANSFGEAPGQMAVEEIAYDSEKPEVASDAALAANGSVTTDLTITDPNRKLIRTVSLDVETESFDTLMAGVSEQITGLQGYVEEQYVYEDQIRDGETLRSANMTIRIPTQQLNEFVTRVESISNVIGSSQTAEDITLTYADTESRVAALEVERDRLMELLEKAETTQDLLEIESRLTEVRYQLESAASQLRLYENLVAYSTVHLNIREVKVLTPTQTATVWERISRGLGETLTSMGDFFENLFVCGVSTLPIWLPIVLLILLLLLLERRARKRKAARKKEEPKEES